MNPLSEILNDLADTDRTLKELNELAEWGGPDPASRANLTALAKRRRDLEKVLDSTLSANQLDLIRLRVEQEDGRPPPAATIARAVILFQEIVTAVFNTVRGDDKGGPGPATEQPGGASLTFATDPGQSDAVLLSIQNDRLLAIRSDLDLAFELTIDLFELRHPNDLPGLGERAGLDSLARLHDWAAMSVAGRLRTSVSWQKTRDRVRTATLSPSQATALERLIATANESSVGEHSLQARLVAFDEKKGTFSLETDDGGQIDGQLSDAFPRGKAWQLNTSLKASLAKTTRVDYATGSRRDEWALHALAPVE